MVKPISGFAYTPVHEGNSDGLYEACCASFQPEGADHTSSRLIGLPTKIRAHLLIQQVRFLFIVYIDGVSWSIFRVGQPVATPGASEALGRNNQQPAEFLDRHVFGDWGNLDKEDKRENEFSLSHRLRILSAYRFYDETKIWVITEADRSATTILLPEEY